MKKILVTLFLLIFSSAACSQECLSSGDVKKQASAAYPSATVSMGDGEATKTFLDAYNSKEPKSDHVADTMEVIDIPGFPQLVIYFFVKNCTVGAMTVTRDDFKEYMQGGI